MTVFEISKTSFFGNAFIGLFLKTNDSRCFLPKHAPSNFKELIERVLKVDAIELFINESNLIGLFTALNNKGVVLPCFAGAVEKKVFKEIGLNTCVLSIALAPGNVVLCNNKGALLSPLVNTKDVKAVRDCLDVEIFQQKLAGSDVVGSGSVATNNGVLAFNEVSDVELKLLEKIFGVPALTGTNNLGNPHNAIGLVANSKGALVGELTTGIEMQRIYEALSE